MSKITTLSGLIGTNGDLTVDTDTLHVDSTNNRVGIGTTSPSTLLDVEGASDSISSMRVANPDVGLKLSAYTDSFAEIRVETNHPLLFKTNGNNERMRIDSSGNVGIGNTSPNTKLDIIGSSTNGSGVVDTLRLRNTGTTINDGPRLQFTAGSSTSGAAIGSQGKALNSADLLFYAGGNSERMRIDSSGNVGIGDSSPLNASGYTTLSLNNTTGSLLDLRVNDGDAFRIQAQSGSSQLVNIYNQPMSFHTNDTERMRLETDGDLHVDGNVIAYSTTISDIRLKKDIAPIEDAVTKVKQLNGCTFTYLKDDRKSAGLIAQDVEKVLPSAVIEDKPVFHGEEGETYKTVQYDQVIGLLVEAVKELKAEIEELKNGSSN
jgi:hypothetical protein